MDENVGAAMSPVNIWNGIRWNASFAYLDPVRDKKGLTIAGDVLVDEINVDGSRAASVDVVHAGEKVTIEAGARSPLRRSLRLSCSPVALRHRPLWRPHQAGYFHLDRFARCWGQPPRSSRFQPELSRHPALQIPHGGVHRLRQYRNLRSRAWPRPVATDVVRLSTCTSHLSHHRAPTLQDAGSARSSSPTWPRGPEAISLFVTPTHKAVRLSTPGISQTPRAKTFAVLMGRGDYVQRGRCPTIACRAHRQGA